MAATGSGQGENDKTGFNYQLETLVFWIDQMRKQGGRFVKFTIGSAVSGEGVPDNVHHAFDDVVLHAELGNGKRITNMIQVKHSKNMIDQAYLCEKAKTYVFKYFKSFLMIKPYINLDELEELVIWTNMRIARNIEDWFETYTPADKDRDVLGTNGLLKYRRFRFKYDKFQEVAQNFLDLVHPRTALVEKFVDVLLKKEEWNSQRAAKDYFRVMAREVIECNGANSKFKQGFVDGQRLLDETIEFRRCFESIMKRRFSEKRIGVFAMADLNSDEYAAHFQVKVDKKFVEGNDPDVQWKPWKEVANDKDLEEFCKRFVFYVEVPEENDLKTILVRNVNNFEELSDLLEKCAFKQMISDKQVESIVTLLSLRHSMNCGPYLKLRFGDLNKLQEEVDKHLSGPITHECLSLRSTQDIDCTISRLIVLVENCLAPSPKRYLVLNLSVFNKNWSKLQQIISDEQLIANGLKCLIITGIQNSRQEQEVRTKLEIFQVASILVGDGLRNGLEDEFDVSTLSLQCKTEISDREICLSEQQSSTASEILQDDIFLKENYPLVLALHRKSMSIESNVLILDENFISRTIKIETNDLDDLIYDDKFSQIVISDQAGMGKSTEMVKIAVDLRKHYQDHLVIYFDCKIAMKHVDCDFTKTICNVMNVKLPAQKSLIECIIRRKQLILLLDGIDEVSDSHRNDLESMLKSILKLSLFKLFIATRPHCDTFIKKIFPNRILCQLPPFSEEDQLEYLIRFWKVDALGDENEHNRVEANIKELITRFRSMLKDGLLIGIPMQTYMIAVIYRESIVLPEFEAPKPYTIGSIYRKFVDLKFNEVAKRQFDTASGAHKNAIDTLEQSFISDHIEMSAKIYINSSEPELEQLCNRLQTYGIVRLHPSVGFVHHTYFEYFITLYFLKYKTDANKGFISFMKQNLCPSRLSIATKFLDHHIDGIDPNTKLQSLIDNTSDSAVSDFEPPATPRLHPEKLREFNHYLRKLSSTDQYTLLRNALNLSVFNVFEVLYDSLPRETKTSLRFCFGKKSEECFINLKLLGGNQMLQLLAVLLKKNPDNFIRRYLTDFSDEEEDFLEVACRKPFIQVLIWLVDDLIPQIDDQEREALSSYVNRRFDKYLQLVVQHNNTVFLEEAINRAKGLWQSSQTVHQFLLERNVLSVFLKNVAVKCNTKSLLVDERIKMVGVMYDLFHWASNGNIVLGQDCINAIRNLENVAIRSAFSDMFQNQ